MRSRFKPLPLAAVVATALVAVLGGCDGHRGPASDGPLGGGAYGSISGGSVCAPARVGQPRTFGIERLTNHGHVGIVLDDVSLLKPHNEHLIGSYAVPGHFLIGVVTWPPNYSGIPSAWKDRRPVHGFRLGPGKTFIMVLGVVATKKGRATSQGMATYYHDSAGSFVLKSHLAMIIAVDKSAC